LWRRVTTSYTTAWPWPLPLLWLNSCDKFWMWRMQLCACEWVSECLCVCKGEKRVKMYTSAEIIKLGLKNLYLVFILCIICISLLLYYLYYLISVLIFQSKYRYRRLETDSSVLESR
jgi:hypothetical protein